MIITAYWVVKINTKKLLFGIVMLIFLMSTAYAAGSKLYFSDVDVKVGSKSSKNLQNGETIDDEAKPGDTVEVKVELKNNFTNSENLDIEDVSLEATLEEIDDGDDLSEEANEFDLGAGDDKRVTFKFEVPEDVDEDTFDIIIEADGDDENGTRHTASMRLKLEVNKESHLLKITRSTLLPTSVQCNRKNVQLGVTVANIGADDEDDVSLRITNEDLGIDIKEEISQLVEDFEDDENKFSKTYTFSVANDLEAGNYPILISALYNNDRKRAEQTATLTVNECLLANNQVTTPVNTNSNNDVEIIGTEQDLGDLTESVIVQDGTVVTSESFSLGSPFVLAMIFIIGLVVIGAIILLIFLMRG